MFKLKFNTKKLDKMKFIPSTKQTMEESIKLQKLQESEYLKLQLEKKLEVVSVHIDTLS